MPKTDIFYCIGISYKKADANLRGRFSITTKAIPFLLEDAKNKVKTMIRKALLKSANDYKSQLEIVKNQIAKKQIEAEKKIKTLQENAEKNIFEATISISATMLSKLDYNNNINNNEIENILKKKNKR